MHQLVLAIPSGFYGFKILTEGRADGIINIHWINPRVDWWDARVRSRIVDAQATDLCAFRQ
jgi:hypothetical protein